MDVVTQRDARSEDWAEGEREEEIYADGPTDLTFLVYKGVGRE